jgi:hypothetical protein
MYIFVKKVPYAVSILQTFTIGECMWSYWVSPQVLAHVHISKGCFSLLLFSMECDYFFLFNVYPCKIVITVIMKQFSSSCKYCTIGQAERKFMKSFWFSKVWDPALGKIGCTENNFYWEKRENVKQYLI